MKMTKNSKIVLLVLLVLVVVGTSIGFASFSKTFTISTSNATVAQATDPFATGLYMTVADSNNGTVSDLGGGTSKGVTWSGLTGTINDSTRTITYTAQMNNASTYIAYLNSVVSSGNLVCTAVNTTQTNQTLVDNCCSALTLTLEVNGYTGTITKTSGINASNLNNGTYKVDAVSAGVNGTAPVKLTLTLASNATLPDGDFVVTIPAITFGYTSLLAN